MKTEKKIPVEQFCQLETKEKKKSKASHTLKYFSILVHHLLFLGPDHEIFIFVLSGRSASTVITNDSFSVLLYNHLCEFDADNNACGTQQKYIMPVKHEALLCTCIGTTTQLAPTFTSSLETSFLLQLSLHAPSLFLLCLPVCTAIRNWTVSGDMLLGETQTAGLTPQTPNLLKCP